MKSFYLLLSLLSVSCIRLEPSMLDTSKNPGALLASLLLASVTGTGTKSGTGTLAASTLYIGIGTHELAVNKSANLLYVTNPFSNTVTFLNAATGAFAFGTQAASTFNTGSAPFAAAVDPAANLLYVANNSSNTVTFFNATTGAYAFGGTFAASSIITGNWPRRLALNPAANLLYIANENSKTLAFLDAATGAYAVGGTLTASSLTTGSVPYALAIDPAANLLYVAHKLPVTRAVTFINATTFAYLNGNFTDSSFATGTLNPNFIAVNPSSNLLYAACDEYVLFFNATTGAYAF